MSNLTIYQIENPIAALIEQLSEELSAFKGDKRDRELREKLLLMVENACEELEMWGHAVGHVSWLASTSEEAERNTIDALGIIGLMQGKFLTINSALGSLKWNVNHIYNKEAGSLVLDDVSQ